MDVDGAIPTPLTALHRRHNAKLVPFAGYSMPLQYAGGIMAEHRQCREKAALFDVSHMGQVVVTARSGRVADAAAALERLVPVDVAGLEPGRQRYAMFTNEAGGILDDLMIAHLGNRLVLVVNAACKAADVAHLKAGLPDCDVTMVEDRALIAIQGPAAAHVMETEAHATADMAFMDVRELALGGVDCVVTRSGYTGEDGFEISVPADHAEGLAEALLASPDVDLAGLGARDSLRLEAGLCLYGSDIDQGTTPVEADLAWAIQKVRRARGAREGGFPGAERILAELRDGPARRRVGLLPEGRAPVRGGAALFAAEEGGEAIGHVTSGTFGPTLGAPCAMGYVPAALADAGTRLFAEVRGKRLPVAVARLPFVPTRYKKA